MLFAPPLEILDLIEDVYDDDGNFIKEKISETATPEQRKIFDKYERDRDEEIRNSFRVDLSDRTYNPIDGWKMK